MTTVGRVAVGLVVASLAVLLVAGANGIHCPQCARAELGERYELWAWVFHLKDALLAGGALLGLASIPLATRRRWGIVAVLLAALLVVLTPM